MLAGPVCCPHHLANFYNWLAGHCETLNESGIIQKCRDKVLSGGILTPDEARRLLYLPDEMIGELACAAAKITKTARGAAIDVEQLANIKKNACSEDCTFCSQSAFYNTDVDTYELPPSGEIVDKARKAKEQGANSYCLVAAWRQPPPDDFERVCEIVSQIKSEIGLDIECSLGFLTQEQAQRLKESGVSRYNHNLETARSKFPEICTTHTYQDRMDTLQTARNAGLELCTGGILGMGESREQRLELLLDMAGMRPEEAAVNILVPVPNTPLELQTPITESEILRTVAVLRFLLPHSIIKLSGGREFHLSDSGKALLEGGANGIITEGYLTMGGNSMSKDMEMIREIEMQA